MYVYMLTTNVLARELFKGFIKSWLEISLERKKDSKARLDMVNLDLVLQYYWNEKVEISNLESF